MKNKMYYIGQKIDAIQVGLLRFNDKKRRIAIEVRAKVENENSLLCFARENTDLHKLVYKKVNVVQRGEEDYLYITGL